MMNIESNFEDRCGERSSIEKDYLHPIALIYLHHMHTRNAALCT